MKRFLCSLLLITAVFSLNAGNAGAAAINLLTEGTATFDGGYWTLGWYFTPNEDITVSALGQWDQEEDGLTTTAEIGIWEVSTQSLLVSAVVGSGTAGFLDNHYRYTTISDYYLQSGTQYAIGSYYDGKVFTYWYEGYSMTVDPLITKDDASWNSTGASFAFTDSHSPSPIAYAGPNFLLSPTAVTEPATMLLLGMGLIGLAGALRKIKR